jgi:Ca2+-binding RTX toxin-like protein
LIDLANPRRNHPRLDIRSRADSRSDHDGRILICILVKDTAMAAFDGNKWWDYLKSQPGVQPITGGAVYTGTSGMDEIYGSDPQSWGSGPVRQLLGNDTLSGGGGDDGIMGRGGNDSISGGDGNDGLYGDGGTDFIFGDAGDDFIDGGADNDTLSGNTGNDTILGGDGNDNITGGQDQDWLSGGTGDDVVDGALGNDTLQGNAGNDTISGGDGNDQLAGGQNNDVLNGGAGADTLTGDLGNDTLTGGSGADVFFASNTTGQDVIQDFNYAEGDRMQIMSGTTGTAYQSGADTIFDMGGGNQIVLVGVNLSSLPTDWAFY